MRGRTRIKLAASAGAALAVAGGGAAVAAGGLSPREESSALIDDAAKQLGVDSAKLADALEQALENRVDEAVAEGRLTEELGVELKARIASGEAPLLGLRGAGPGLRHHAHGPGTWLDTAAAFLGLTQAELREQLHDGKTLAEIAGAEGKTVTALVGALVAAVEQELAEAVESGRLTDAQRDRILEELDERITEGVNATPGRHFRGGPRLRGPGFRGGPGAAPPAGESGYRFGGGTEPPAAA